MKVNIYTEHYYTFLFDGWECALVLHSLRKESESIKDSEFLKDRKEKIDKMIEEFDMTNNIYLRMLKDDDKLNDKLSKRED